MWGYRQTCRRSRARCHRAARYARAPRVRSRIFGTSRCRGNRVANGQSRLLPGNAGSHPRQVRRASHRFHEEVKQRAALCQTGLAKKLTLEIDMPVAAHRSQAPSAVRTELTAIFISLELSQSKWLVTSLAPGNGEKMSKFVVATKDVAGHVIDNRRARPQVARGSMEICQRWRDHRGRRIDHRVALRTPFLEFSHGFEPWVDARMTNRVITGPEKPLAEIGLVDEPKSAECGMLAMLPRAATVYKLDQARYRVASCNGFSPWIQPMIRIYEMPP